MTRKPNSAKKPAAEKTNGSVATAATKPCIACASDIPALATVCQVCKTAQVPISPCIKCGKTLTQGTRFCNDCKTWQDGKFHFSITQWVSVFSSTAVIGVITFLYYCLPSRTSLSFENADADALYVLVTNKAPKNPSHLVEARLDFGKFPLENAMLEPMAGDEKKNVFEPGHTSVGLTPRGLGTKIKPETSEPYTREEILLMLKHQNPQSPSEVTLWIKIEESNGVERLLQKPIPITKIQELIFEKLTDRGT